MVLKIAISGKMCSGKTTLNNLLQQELEKEYGSKCIPLKLAEDLYYIHDVVFGRTFKDRPLLIDIGDFFCAIDPDVFIKSALRKMKKYEDEPNNAIICDDLRKKNEYDKLTEEQFLMIRLHIDPETQLKRLKAVYPDTWQTQITKMTHITETGLDDVHVWDLEFDVSKINQHAICDVVMRKIKNMLNEATLTIKVPEYKKLELESGRMTPRPNLKRERRELLGLGLGPHWNTVQNNNWDFT